MQAITVENKDIIESWYEESRKQTLETLPKFLQQFVDEYKHDYGTICHAVAVAALAAAHALNRNPLVEISNHQSWAIMFYFIRHWSYLEGPLKLIEFRDMLYFQNAETFEKIISKGTMDYLQAEAQRLLSEQPRAFEAQIEHWKSLAAGNPPFGYKVQESDPLEEGEE